MTWQPVLDGELAAEARAAAREIADDLERLEPALRRPVDEALLWAYVAGAFGDGRAAERYDAAIDAFQARLEEPFAVLRLYGGLAGAGWVLAHVSDDAGDFLQEIDLTLTRALAEPWPWGYDLIAGLTGLGVYFVERLRAGAATARSGLARVVELLAETAEVWPEGTTWLSPPEILPPWQRELAPSGHYDVGVAHGVPGVIALLGVVAGQGDAELAGAAARARELGAGATRWLRARPLPPDPRGRFPAMITREAKHAERARTAWCYGDLGIAVALWSTAVRTGADATEWRELALECAQRPAELCGVADPNLCHGAAGLAHLCNRFFQASGDERFRRAARGWFERTLAMRRPGEGIAGFLGPRSRAPGAVGPPELGVAPDFLDGTIGVALALLAGVGGEEPGWDRLMLCDLPPRGP